MFHMTNISSFFCRTLTRISPRLNTAIIYCVKFKRQWNEKNPVTLNDKILWLKFHTYWNNLLVKQCADKLAVREYVRKMGCGELLIDSYGVYDKVDDIPWNNLPKQCVLKLNTGCGCNIIVADRDKLDINFAKNKLRKGMSEKYYLAYSEMQYKDVKPYVLCEKYICEDDGTLPLDYKFYCMNGKADSVMVCLDRDGIHHPKFFFMDRNWNKLPYTKEVFQYPDIKIEKPQKMDEAFDVAEKLAKEFPFVRVDLYIVKNKIYFGELTFTPAAGMDTDFKFKAPGKLKDTDTILGELLKLPI